MCYEPSGGSESVSFCLNLKRAKNTVLVLQGWSMLLMSKPWHLVFGDEPETNVKKRPNAQQANVSMRGIIGLFCYKTRLEPT